MSGPEPGLPELPTGWCWEATVTEDTVTVRVVNTTFRTAAGEQRDVTVAERRGECPSDRREQHIYRLAADLWLDLNSAAQLSAKLGIEVLYG